MNFTMLSPLGFAAGLLGLAGALYLLQRLRVRHRELDVVTTMFWREAVEDTRARVLVQRFRHPWAYLFILLIASLLWAAFAGAGFDAEPSQRHVFVLDTSAASAHAGRFETLKARLLETVQLAPRDSREVISCGASEELLLAPGEDLLFLEARLEKLEPQATLPSWPSTLDRLALGESIPTEVLLFGDGIWVDEESTDAYPEFMRIRNVSAMSDEQDASRNRGVTGLGFDDAASGAWDAVDLFVQVDGKLGEGFALRLSLDGEPLTDSVTRTDASGASRWIARDVPARGGLLEARITPGDSLELDNVARLRLPDRPRLRVLISQGASESLRVALETDPAVQLVEDNPDVVVRTSGETIGEGIPAIVAVQSGEQDAAFQVQHEPETGGEEVLAEVVSALALDEIDATGLAQATNRTIRVATSTGNTREVRLWAELTGPEFDFVGSRAFPMFIGGSLRWLAQVEELPHRVAAGETWLNSVSLTNADGRKTSGASGRGLPVVAGEYADSEGRALTASLLSSHVTKAQPQLGDANPLEDVKSQPADLVTWLLVLAAVFLFVEWRQVRLGRMP